MQFVVTQDRSHIYPLRRKEICVTPKYFSGELIGIQVRMGVIPLGGYDSIRECHDVVRQITGIDHRDGAVFVMPGYSEYSIDDGLKELLDLLHQKEGLE